MGPMKSFADKIFPFSVALFLSVSTSAQESIESLASATAIEQVILPVGQADVGGSIVIDTSSETYLIFGSPRRSLNVTITSPSSIEYSIDDPSSNGVESFVSPDRANATAGLNYIFRFENPETGAWSYSIGDSIPRTTDSAAFLMTSSDSHIQAGVLGGGADYTVGKEMTLAAFVVENSDAISTYTLSGSVKKPTGGRSWQPIVFVDDGSSGDFAAGDGIKTAIYKPTEIGLHKFKGRISGTSDDGKPFVRIIASTFRVIEASADIESFLNDRGIDNDGDGYFDEIGLDFLVNATKAGDYFLRVTLETSSGETITANTAAALSMGSANIEALFDAEVLKQVGDDGPYSIINALLEIQTIDDVFVVDRHINMGITSKWQLNQLQRKPIELTGTVQSLGQDTNGSGFYDNLIVSFDIDFVTRGYYSYSAQLVDTHGTEVGFAAGSQSLPSQATIALNFAGLPIGENGVDGPYILRNFAINGPNSRIVDFIGETDSLKASQFEGYVEPDTEPPELQLTVTPEQICPPNHQMVEVGITYNVSDNMDPNPSVMLVSVVSSDGENEIGDGNTSNDTEVLETGAILLRAERAGPKESRIYTITYKAIDAAGNTAIKEAHVTVPRSKRR